MREVEQLVSSPEWQGSDGGGGPRTHAPGEGLEELGGDRLFPSDPRVAFVLLNVPSFVPYQDFSAASKIQPDFFAAIGADQHFPGAGLTVGATLGVDRPASFTPPVKASSASTSGASASRSMR